MAFVPELDDDTKPGAASTDDQSDINSQAADSNIATDSGASAGGGQSVQAGQAAKGPSSSGSFQDFSKFKAANSSKLSALQNLATDQASTNANNAKSAFDNAGSAFSSKINSNAKNFDTSAYKNLNKDSTLDAAALGADLDSAANKVDGSQYAGQLAGTDEYTNLQNTENQLSNLNSRAGTASVLGDLGSKSDANYSAQAANQDALLLRSENGYRQKANEIATNSKGLATNELGAQQNAVQASADAVNKNNADYRTKALDSLKGLSGTIDQDLQSRAATEQAKFAAQNSSDYAAAAKKAADAIRQDAFNKYQAASNSFLATGNPLVSGDATAKAMNDAAAESGRLKNLSDADIVNTYNSPLTQAVKNYQADQNAAGSYTANNVYANDTARQAQVAALQQLLAKGGADYASAAKTYNGNVSTPTVNSTALSPMDQLIQTINSQKVADKSSDYLNGLNAAVAQVNTPVAPVSNVSAGAKNKSAATATQNQKILPTNPNKYL